MSTDVFTLHIIMFKYEMNLEKELYFFGIKMFQFKTHSKNFTAATRRCHVRKIIWKHQKKMTVLDFFKNNFEGFRSTTLLKTNCSAGTLLWISFCKIYKNTRLIEYPRTTAFKNSYDAIPSNSRATSSKVFGLYVNYNGSGSDNILFLSKHMFNYSYYMVSHIETKYYSMGQQLY